MKYLSAILLAMAVTAAQLLHGGLRDPALADPAYALLVLAAMASAFGVWRNPNPATAGPLIAACIFVGYIAWRCASAPDAYLGRLDFFAALSGLLAFTVAAYGLPDQKARLAFLFLLGVAALGQSIIGLVQFGRGVAFTPLGWFSQELRQIYENRFLTRAHGFYLNPDHYAWFCGSAALFCAAIGCWGRVSVVARVILIYFTLFFIGCDVLSGSRGGLLSLFVGFVAFGLVSMVAIFTTMTQGRTAFASGAVLLMVTCATAGWLVYSSNWVMQGRVDMIFVGEIRGYLFGDALRLFQTAPLIGAGPGMFLYAARFYRDGIQPYDPTYAHDDWIQLLSEYGLVGFGLASLLVAVLLAGGIRRFFAVVRYRVANDGRPMSNSGAIVLASLSALIMFVVHSAIDFNMHIPANALLAGATLGLLAGRESPDTFGRIETGILRAFSFVAIMVAGVALSFGLWRHWPADFENLRASNALIRGDVRAALALTEGGLQKLPNDPGLLLTKGKASYAYESFLEAESESSQNAKDGKDGDDESSGILTPAEREKIYRSSAEALAAVVAQRPLERDDRIQWAKALAELGDDRAARRQFLEGIGLDQTEGYTYAAYGDYLYDRENLSGALGIYGLGRYASDGGYSGSRYIDITEEMAPPPADESAPEDSTPGPDDKADETESNEESAP